MAFTVYHNRQVLTLGAALQKQISLPSICRSRVIIAVCSKFSISLPAEFSLQKFLSREIKQCFIRCDKAAGLILRPDSTLNGEQIYYRSGFPLKAGVLQWPLPFILNCAWLPFQNNSTIISSKNKHGFGIRVVCRKKKKTSMGTAQAARYCEALFCSSKSLRGHQRQFIKEQRHNH